MESGKRYLLIIVLICSTACFMGCSGERKVDPEEKAICSGDGSYYMTGEGIYFRDEQFMLRYFDMDSGTTVVVCDKAECEHKSAEISGTSECNAQIGDTDQMAVFHDQVYYLTTGDEYDTEQLRCRDLDGNNDKKVAQFQGSLCNADADAWFYRDYLMVITRLSSGKTFDAENGEADDSRLQLNCINLETGKCDVVQQSSGLSGIGYSIYKAENGKFFYYSVEKECFFEYDPETKNQQALNVSCTAKIGGNQDDSASEYHFAYGDFCYGVSGEPSRRDKILEMNISTGEEKCIYSSENVYYASYQDYILIIDYLGDMVTDWDFYLYDTGKQELTKLQNSFLNEPGMCVFKKVSRTGVFFLWAVNAKPGQEYYAGDFEYRYMKLNDLLDGKDDYTSVYYLDQE